MKEKTDWETWWEAGVEWALKKRNPDADLDEAAKDYANSRCSSDFSTRWNATYRAFLGGAKLEGGEK